MNTHKRDITIITVLSISAIVLALLLSRHLWFRLDLTRNHLYTISAVSRNLRNEIPDQVRITYYLSDKLAAMHPVPREIADMLREYAAYSRGKITVTVRDPVKAKLTDAVDALGVQAQQIQTEERNEMNFALVYSALVIEYLDKTDVVPWIFSLETLEYDLTSRIRTLVRGTQREAGILVGDAGKTLENNYRHAGDILTQAGFRVRPVAAGEEIPGGLSLLLVFGGTESLDHWALYRIDHYLRSGGKAFFAVEAVLAEFQGQPAARAMDDQGLLAMLSRYGATVQPELTLDRSALMLQYQRSMPNGTVQHRISQYPLWFSVLPENGNRASPVTNRFGGLDLFWANHIDLAAPEGVAAESLFTTTEHGWLETKNFSISPETDYLMTQEMAATEGKKILAASLAGVLPSYFEGRQIPVRKGSEETLPGPVESPQPSRIILVADADVASMVIQRQQNLDFLVQAALWLSSDDDIIGIRNRQSGGGRLDKITDPEKRSRAMAVARWFNILVMPAVLIAAGILAAWKRRKNTYAATKD